MPTRNTGSSCRSDSDFSRGVCCCERRCKNRQLLAVRTDNSCVFLPVAQHYPGLGCTEEPTWFSGNLGSDCFWISDFRFGNVGSLGRIDDSQMMSNRKLASVKILLFANALNINKWQIQQNFNLSDCKCICDSLSVKAEVQGVFYLSNLFNLLISRAFQSQNRKVSYVVGSNI